MEKFFLKIWYQDVYYANLISLCLIPLSCIYICLFYIRALFYKNKKFSVPIICIGNINIGGTGKTSTLLTLIEEIKNGSWIIKKNETNNMFSNDSKKMWGENMKQMDEKFKIWSNAPEDPQNN